MTDGVSSSSSSSSSSSAIPFVPEEWSIIFFHLICPSLGCILATAMFAAPIADLRTALLRQSLGELNPRPWAVMTGNCLGWCAYAYYIHDPFILASNIPGLILSMWLNVGAAKLQYQQTTTTMMSRRDDERRQHRPAPLLHVVQSNNQNQRDIHAVETYDNTDSQYFHVPSYDSSSPLLPPPVFTPQEIWWLRVMMLWSMTLVWVGWVSPFDGYEAATVGLLVNLNLIFFYGVPLQTISDVVRKGHSNSIHPPSMIMACGNSTFWLLYGVALWDPVLMIPNSIGLSLGLCQVILCAIYPKRSFDTYNGRQQQHHARSGSSSTVGNDNISLTGLPTAPPEGIFRDLRLSSTFRNNHEEEEEDDKDDEEGTHGL